MLNIFKYFKIFSLLGTDDFQNIGCAKPYNSENIFISNKD